MLFTQDFFYYFYLCHVFMYFYVYCNISFINLKQKYYSSKSITFFTKTEHYLLNLEYCFYLIKENILSL